MRPMQKRDDLFQPDLGDDPKSGRPKTLTNEENTTRVDKLIRCDRRMKIREIALKLEIPKSTVHEMVHDTLEYRKVSVRWVPKMLREDHKLQRVEISQRLLQRCQLDNGDEDTAHIGVGPGGDFQANNNLFDNLITGDETWVHVNTPETKRDSMTWKHPSSPVTKKFKMGILRIIPEFRNFFPTEENIRRVKKFEIGQPQLLKDEPLISKTVLCTFIAENNLPLSIAPKL
ncbi:histone-lysine N-methyltransferase SETMAR [Plakobranchus ocellatus]|uniref:Histone-lysine N-methyltransferase SETMAR n=1 Tax=Plakobranchus ocellatus TaxID=259542 RepID=A0AAV3ZQZ3_9GAST|nr:histone-lysine N-methyltransferase SETMAR [Plakobranchus ocellatus]